MKDPTEIVVGRLDRLRFRESLETVCLHYGTTLEEAIGKGRTARVARARHASWAWLRARKTRSGKPIMSYPDIAILWGGVDHTTVRSGILRHAEEEKPRRGRPRKAA